MPASRSRHSGQSSVGEPAEPQLLYSSKKHGWSDLEVCEYREPAWSELWPKPHAPMLTLGLLTRGMVNFEMRPVNGLWHGTVFHQDQFFLQPDYLQAYEFRWQSYTETPIHGLYLYLPHRVLFRCAQEVADRDPTRLTFTDHVGFHDPLLLQLGHALQRELKQPTTVGPIYAQTAAQMLAVHLLQHYTSTSIHVQKGVGALTQRKVQCVRDFVQEHIACDLSLSALAEQVNLSAYHFARMFRQATGESPHQFVLRQRLEHAQVLLRTTDMPIVDVALTCGFANQGYLTTVFKQRFGLTPKAYRNRMGL